MSTSEAVRPLDAFVVCGPSGVGKGTLLGKLFKDYGDRFAFSVSHTTRAPRAGEQNGREYHFAEREAVVKMRDNNEFLELCEVHGNLYGTSVAAVKAVREEGKVCMIEIDVQGAQKLRSRPDHAVNAAYLFVTAPIEEIEKRIRGRGADNDETIHRRLETAKSEYKFLEANPTFFSAVVVNDDLNGAYGRLVDALNAEFAKHNMPLLEKKTN